VLGLVALERQGVLVVGVERQLAQSELLRIILRQHSQQQLPRLELAGFLLPLVERAEAEAAVLVLGMLASQEIQVVVAEQPELAVQKKHILLPPPLVAS
jgi:hypothetical protein